MTFSPHMNNGGPGAGQCFHTTTVNTVTDHWVAAQSLASCCLAGHQGARRDITITAENMATQRAMAGDQHDTTAKYSCPPGVTLVLNVRAVPCAAQSKVRSGQPHARADVMQCA